MSNNGILHPIILLVEDDRNLASGLIYNLESEGYRVLWAENGKKALDVFQESKVDLVVLDIMLPYYNGLEILERIRSSSPAMPVLILSAKSEPQDRIKGLTLGADDYLSKPFHLKELLLRIKGMLKRSNWYRESICNIRQFSFCHFHIDFENLMCKTEKDSFRMTPLEGALLKYFVENENQVISREEILRKVWQINMETDTRTVDNFVMRLRKYFEENPSNPVYFKNIRTKGYIFRPQGEKGEKTDGGS